jgi:hypothetical protein
MPTDKFEQMLKTIRVPIWLTANKTWYVRTDGNDANDGSANDAAHAFRTIQKAVNYISENFNVGTYSATVQIGAGMYSENVILPKYSSSTGSINLKGSGKTNTNVVVINKVGINAVASSGKYAVSDLSISASVNSEFTPGVVYCVHAQQGVDITLQNVDLVYNEGAGVVGVTRSVARAAGGIIRFSSGCRIQANGQSTGSGIVILLSNDGGVVWLNEDMEINGICATTILLSLTGLFRRVMTPGRVITGTVTGTRYAVSTNAICDTAGGGANFFPGNAAGSTSTGGQYL